MKHGIQNCMTEWSLVSSKRYQDPFNEIEVSAVFTGPEGHAREVPAFWAGDNIWRVRYASPIVGRHHYQTVCTDAGNADLHGQEGEIEVTPYDSSNPALRHGPLRVAKNKRHLEHIDGTPFFWLADTWWMGLCKRLSWPGDFQALTADRVAKGFSVIQIVAGLYSDMPPFDERGASEAGFPWEQDYTRINPDYFDTADARIAWLVKCGLIPCIVGCWGYFLTFMGMEKTKQHWRNLVARYGAYPVVWCLSGESVMPYYWSDTQDEDRAGQTKGWTEVAQYVRGINAFNHPITIHPGRGTGKDQIEDPGLMDFEMLQPGHKSHVSFPDAIKEVRSSIPREPRMPVLVGEACYEGEYEANREEIQRLLFWCCILCGAFGHSYGANGIWQVNTRDRPFGPSPSGSAFGDIAWEEASQLPGSRNLGIGKKFLEQYPWWEFESHPEWVRTPSSHEDEYFVPYAGGIAGKLRIVFFSPFLPLSSVTAFEDGVTYHAFLFDPSTGRRYELGKVEPDEEGEWPAPTMPIIRDWVLVMESAEDN